jgi:hypothetical protein
MPLSIELAKVSFAAGEVSPQLRARDDLAKNQTACWFLENMVPILEGGVTRSPGTRMIMPYKDPSRVAAAVPFRFAPTGSNAYLLVFNAGVIRWILGNGVVQAAGGGNYEVAHPYTDADLGGPGAAVAGVSSLRYTANGNVIFLFCDGHQAQTLTRNADNSWTLAPYVPQGGPVDPVNTNPAITIGVSATTGIVALIGTGTNFQAGNVGGVWRLDESTLSLIPEWTGNETITVPVAELPAATGNIGSLTNLANAFDENLATEATQSNIAAGAYAYAGQTFAAGQAIVSATIQDAGNYIAFNTAAVGLPAWNSGTHYNGGDQVTYAGSIWQALFGNFGQVPNGGSGVWGNIGPTAFNATVFLYAKNGVPANATDGTLLGASGVGSGLGYSVTVQSSDAISTWTNIWFAITPSGSANIAVAEIDLFQFSGGGTAVLRRWNGNVYQAISSGNSGANPPVHTARAVLSGVGGVTWLYRHRDRGFVQITGVNSATSAVGTVLERIPDSVQASPTAVWWPASWDGVVGWPDRVGLSQNALVSARAGRFWKTQPGSFFNYDITDPTNPSSALAGQLVSEDGSQVNIEWFMQSTYLAAGARDNEWVLSGANPFAGLSVQNLQPFPAQADGSAVHIPARCEGGMAFIGRTRTRLHHTTVAFGYVMPSMASEELTITARHILAGKALGVSHQRDPNRINWIWCQDGTLVSETLMKAQQINGWARHPQHAPTNSAIEWVVTIPSLDEGVSWTYMGTRRTINGATARFVELKQPFFTPANPAAPDSTNAWFVDCGLQYTGAPVLTVTGLDHLNGQRVNVHADGAMYFNPDGTLPLVGPVAGGIGITLTRLTSNCIVGLPISYRIRLLPLDVQTPKGSTQGARGKANHFLLNVVNAAGGNIAGNPDAGGQPEALDGTGALTYGAPVPLITGIIRTQGIWVPLDDQLVVEITGSDTMPFTLTGVTADVEVTEND